MIQTHSLTQPIATLLKKAGFSTTIISMEKCEKGGNNRTYQVETRDGLFAVKKYFRQPGDKRDRLTSEFAFLSYAKKVAPNMVPTPYSYDAEEGLALYEFIEGKPFQANTITQQEVSQAVTFFCALNQPQTRMSARHLPLASEACFAIQEHIDLIDARVIELLNFHPESAEDFSAKQFIERINTRWQIILKNLNSENQLDFSLSLDATERCLSPSDFGFHNALRMTDGSIRFLDFEYAGWDDPGKMVGDFFAQLAVPIPANLFHHFVHEVMAVFAKPEELVHRAHLLRSLYQVKWCCIALNIFLPIHLARRRFANPDLDVSMIKRAQLAKVEILIQNLEK